MSYENTYYSLLILLKLLLYLILNSADLAASSSCQSECGGTTIPKPFGIGYGCYVDKYYEIECRNSTSSRKLVPFLSKIRKEVVSISLPNEESYYSSGSSRIAIARSYGLVRVKSPITSTGCFRDGKEPAESLIMNLTGSPFFSAGLNSLTAVGCNSKVSLTHIKPNMVGCELNCNTNRDLHSSNIPFYNKSGCSSDVVSVPYDQVCTEIKLEETECDGNGCCQASLPNEPQQVIGIKIESNDGNSTTREHCKVAFLTDEVFTLSNGTKPEELFAKGYATHSLGWVIQTENNSFLNSLTCKMRKDNSDTSYFLEPNIKCICTISTISKVSYANCGCNSGYKGNPYVLDGCVDINECRSKPNACGKGNTCVNTLGGYQCVADKTKAIMIGKPLSFPPTRVANLKHL